MSIYIVASVFWIAAVMGVAVCLGNYLDEKEKAWMGKTKSKVKKKKRRLMAAAKANGTENSNGKKKGK